MKDSIRDIRGNGTSGASQLAFKILEAMKKALELSKAKDPEGLYQGLVEVGKTLILAQPSMPSTFNLVNCLLLQAERGLKMEMEELRGLMRAAGERVGEEFTRAQTMLNQKGRELLRGRHTVLTYSYSNTVRDILMGSKGIEVILSEGRPNGEGRMLAKDLGEEGIRCTLMVDTALTASLPQADLVLVGTDRVSERTFVSKIGTEALAIQAGQIGVPLYTPATTYQFLSSRILPFQPQLKGPTQISPQLENVKVVNIPSQEVPLTYLSGVITEEGILSSEQINKKVKGMEISPSLASLGV